MRALDDAFQINKQLLLEAAEVCCSLPREIDYFTSIVSSRPMEMVKFRLIAIKSLIIVGECILRVQHEDKGFIFVIAGHNSLNVHWFEHELLAAQKEWLSYRGNFVIPPEVVVYKVEQLLSQVNSGELVQAVDWLSRYGSVFVDGVNGLP